MSNNNIEVKKIEDGGNPRQQKSIHKIGKNRYIVYPSSEDEDPNYKFRFEISATNKSDHSQQLDLEVSWNEPIFATYRSMVYLNYEEEKIWHPVAVTKNRNSTTCKLNIPPGETKIASQPAYTYSDYLRLIERASSYDDILVECIGYTAQKRKIFQIILNNRGRVNNKRPIVIVCRIHPYETAGSFCAEGIINNYYTGEFQLHKKFRSRRVHLIPMANPDGVFNGLCKKTGIDGIDLSKQIDCKDQTCATLMKLLQTVKPKTYCEIHNWMLPEVDGLYFLNRFKAYRFIHQLPRNIFKKWKIEFRKIILPSKPQGLKQYCKSEYNSTAFVLELRWFSRSVFEMEKIGVSVIKAIANL